MSVSAEGAEKYYDEALKKIDYYAKELGVWGPKGADRLGLKGEVTREEFLTLASNKVPGTEENLTVRTKDKRTAAAPAAAIGTARSKCGADDHTATPCLAPIADWFKPSQRDRRIAEERDS